MSSAKDLFNFSNRGKIVLALVFVGLYFLAIQAAPLPLLTYDSYDYIGASESLNAYFFGSNSDHITYLYRQPALPFYLHFFSDKVLAAKWLNAICYLVSLLLSYVIARELKFENRFKFLFVLLAAGSYPWIQNHFFVWTEPLFACLVLALVLLIIAKKSWGWVCFVCLLLYFTRRAGLFLIAGTVAAYLSKREFKNAMLVSLTSSLVVAGWEIVLTAFSNNAIYQSFFSDLAKLSHWSVVDAISSWFLPRTINLAARLLILSSVITIFSFRFREILSRLIGENSFKAILVISSTYLLLLLFMGATEYNEAERFGSVMLPAVMLIIVSIVRSSIVQAASIGNYLWPAFVVWTLYPLGRTIYHLLM